MKLAERNAAADLILAIERELRQIGEELHDNICQTLAGTSMLVRTMGRLEASGKAVPKKTLQELGRLLEAATGQTRALSKRYGPINLAGAGLMKALEELARDDPKCEFRCDKALFVRREEEGLAIYRVAQEAMRNALQYGQAKKVRVSLRGGDTEVILSVRDNGRGLKSERLKEILLGIRMMELRVRVVGGTLQITAMPRLGTAVICKIPRDRSEGERRESEGHY